MIKFSYLRTFLLVTASGAMALLPLAAEAAAGASTPRHLLQVSMPGDDALNCPAIAGEVSAMDQVVVNTREAKTEASHTGTGIGVVRTVGSLLIGSLGGAIGIFAAGHLASSAAEDRAEDAEAIEDIAQQRRSMMIGMYRAKGCEAEAPLQTTADPAPEVDPQNVEPAAGETLSPAPSPRYND